eukprot:SAG11_NODE_15125_length_588_cov_1.155419_1_plen_49_part_10
MKQRHNYRIASLKACKHEYHWNSDADYLMNRPKKEQEIFFFLKKNKIKK